MKKKQSYLVFIGFFTLVSACGSLSSDAQNHLPIDDKDRQILSAIHNGELEEASRNIDRIIESEPKNPKGYFLRAMMAANGRYFLSQGASRDSLREILEQSSLRTIEFAEMLPENTHRSFYLGAAYSYLSRAYLFKQKWTDGYFAAKKGKNYLNEVIEANASYADAYLHLGVLSYFAATQQAWWQKSLALISGIDQDKPRALQYIQKTYDKGNFHKYEAIFILAAIYNFIESDPVTAEHFTNAHVALFPKNTFMKTMHKFLEFSKLLDSRGPEYILAHADSLKDEYAITNSGRLNRIGYNYIANKDFQKAEVIFLTNIRFFPESVNVHDSMAECYFLMGNRAKSREYYELAYQKLSADKSIDEDFRISLKEGIESKLQDLR